MTTCPCGITRADCDYHRHPTESPAVAGYSMSFLKSEVCSILHSHFVTVKKFGKLVIHGSAAHSEWHLFEFDMNGLSWNGQVFEDTIAELQRRWGIKNAVIE